MPHEEIVDGCADALFAYAWSSAIEERGRSFKAGLDISEVVPPTPACLKLYARGLLMRIQELNKALIDDVYARNVELDGHMATPRRHTFGWYLGTEHMGLGVSWSDDHPHHDLDIPYGEVHIALDERFSDVAYVDAGDVHQRVQLRPRMPMDHYSTRRKKP